MLNFLTAEKKTDAKKMFANKIIIILCKLDQEICGFRYYVGGKSTIRGKITPQKKETHTERINFR